MNAPQDLVKTVEVVLIKSMVTLAVALQDMMEPTVKLVILQYHFKLSINIRYI